MDNSTKNIQKAILFCNPVDIRTGFLSNESKHGFTLEEKRWKTVEHYIQAKKFEGTHYEDEIRLCPTVFQVKRLTKSKDEIFIGDNGKINRTPVYGRTGEYRIRKDWSSATQARFLEEGVRAKFIQNNHLSRRLIDTRNAKLIDEKNKLLGSILEKIRRELNKNNIASSLRKTNAPSLFQLDKIKDLKFHKLPQLEKSFVIGIITIAKRISIMEGWDKIFKEMVEDVVYILTSNKTEIKDIFDYINFFYKIEWTKLYRDMPNIYEIIHEIQEIFKEIDKSSQGSHRSITITAMLVWLNIAATTEQKKNIYSKIKKSKTLHISIPKVQRWYRQQKPPLPVKRNKSKIRDKSKIKLLSTGNSTISNISVLLTLSEKKFIDEIFEEQDCKGNLDKLSITELQKIVKRKMKGFPTIDRQELKKYVSDSHKEIFGSEKVETEKVETEKVETEKVETEKVETEKVETEKVETEKETLSIKEKKLILKVFKKYKIRLNNVSDKILFFSKKLKKVYPNIKLKKDFEQYISEEYIKINKEEENKVLPVEKEITPVEKEEENKVLPVEKEITPVEKEEENKVLPVEKEITPVEKEEENKVLPVEKEEVDYLKYTLSEDPIDDMSDYEETQDYSSDSDLEDEIPVEIKKAILYIETFGPLNLPNEIYSNIIKKLGELSESKSMFYINRWKELNITDRKSEVFRFLES
jgi:predicted NAD-dependent protein-ADP-ribosyltransferase YbiA (DUF1768 family)